MIKTKENHEKLFDFLLKENQLLFDPVLVWSPPIYVPHAAV